MYRILLVVLLAISTVVCGGDNSPSEWFDKTIKDLDPTETDGPILYVSPSGELNACSEVLPCNIRVAAAQAVSGDLILLREGIYTIQSHIRLPGGTTWESHPDEWAILDGSPHIKGEHVNIIISGDYTTVRLLEIRNMPRQGLWITGNYNLFEGINSHHNTATGIHVFSGYTKFPYGEEGSYNVIRHNWVHDNSDVGYTNNGLADGGNADGIAVSSGERNIIEDNLVHDNSDDGIDSWRSTNTVILNNEVYGHGLGAGNGNGIKAGGSEPSNATVVIGNKVHNNIRIGITNNTGPNVVMYDNESYDNGLRDYFNGPSGIMLHNEQKN